MNFHRLIDGRGSSGDEHCVDDDDSLEEILETYFLKAKWQFCGKKGTLEIVFFLASRGDKSRLPEILLHTQNG